jgi:hypothetical protein
VADGVVANTMLPDPEVTLPNEVVIEKLRLGSPLTEKASAETVLPETRVTVPTTDPTPAGVTTITPPVPTVNEPKLSEAPDV